MELFFFLLFSDTIEEDVQHDGANAAQGDAAVKDDLGPIREGMEEVGHR